MARVVKQKHGGTLHMLEKGERILGNGARRRTRQTLINNGYSLKDINQVIQKILQLTFQEVRELLTDHESTILEMSIARALQQSLRKGDLYAMETLLTRRFGRPRESVAITEYTATEDTDFNTSDPVEAGKRYRALIES